MECAIYNRISADNAGDGHGVVQHEVECRKLADKLGWTVVAVFADNDISAHSGKPRAGYKALMKAADNGEFKAIVTRDLDRMHRNLSEFDGFVTACLDYDIEVQSVLSGHMNLSTASGRMVARMVAVVAQHEVDHMIERQRASHAYRAAEGKYRGGKRPFGFEHDGMTLNKVEGDALAEGSRLILEGASTGSIVRLWNDAGVLTTSGNRWEITTVRRVLSRPRNAGLSEHKGEIVGEASWPAIVSEDDWRGVCAILSRPRVRWGREDSERKWTGSGVYVCGVCGGKLQVNVNYRKIRQYRCIGGHLTRALEPLDEFVSELVLRKVRSIDLLTQPVKGVDVRGLHRTRAGFEARLQELALLFSAGDIDSNQLRTATKELKDKIAAIDDTIAASRVKSPLTDLLLVSDADERWKELGPEMKGNIISALMTVTVLPIPVARRNKPFDTQFIKVDWKSM